MRRLAVLLALPLLALVACGDDDDEAAGSFCDRARTFDEEFEAFEGEPTAASFEEAADTIESLADGAPDEIQEDIELMAREVREVAELYADFEAELTGDPDDITEEQAEAIAAAGDEIGTKLDALEEPGERIETYLQEECGIDPDE